MPYTKYLQVLVRASNVLSESWKQGILCSLLNLKSVQLILQFLSNSEGLVLSVLDCVTQYLCPIVSSPRTYFAILVASSFMYLV